MSEMFASLKYRNFRLWYFGQLTSLFGTWMQYTAQGYLAFELTKSPEFLGWMAFANGAPTWFLMIPAGVVAERMSKRRILIIAQVSMMIVAFMQAGLSYYDMMRPWHLIVTSIVLGIANAFDAPARTAFVIELVERKVLGNAVALNGGMFNLASTLGPALAGACYAIWGPETCFLINGISFFAVLYGLLMMRMTEVPAYDRSKKMFDSLREGLSYVRHHPDVRAVIMLIGCIGMFGASIVSQFPAWSELILGEGARGTGLLNAARGGGALVATFLIVGLTQNRKRGKLMMVSTIIFPCALLVFSLASSLWISLTVLALAGFMQFAMANLGHGIMQAMVEDRYRARAMSIFGFVFFGAVPLGSIMIGLLAEAMGLRMALIFCAVAYLICALAIWRKRPELTGLA